MASLSEAVRVDAPHSAQLAALVLGSATQNAAAAASSVVLGAKRPVSSVASGGSGSGVTRSKDKKDIRSRSRTSSWEKCPASAAAAAAVASASSRSSSRKAAREEAALKPDGQPTPAAMTLDLEPLPSAPAALSTPSEKAQKSPLELAAAAILKPTPLPPEKPLLASLGSSAPKAPSSATEDASPVSPASQGVESVGPEATLRAVALLEEKPPPVPPVPPAEVMPPKPPATFEDTTSTSKQVAPAAEAAPALPPVFSEQAKPPEPPVPGVREAEEIQGSPAHEDALRDLALAPKDVPAAPPASAALQEPVPPAISPEMTPFPRPFSPDMPILPKVPEEPGPSASPVQPEPDADTASVQTISEETEEARSAVEQLVRLPSQEPSASTSPMIVKPIQSVEQPLPPVAEPDLDSKADGSMQTVLEEAEEMLQEVELMVSADLQLGALGRQAQQEDDAASLAETKSSMPSLLLAPSTLPVPSPADQPPVLGGLLEPPDADGRSQVSMQTVSEDAEEIKEEVRQLVADLQDLRLLSPPSPSATEEVAETEVVSVERTLSVVPPPVELLLAAPAAAGSEHGADTKVSMQTLSEEPEQEMQRVVKNLQLVDFAAASAEEASLPAESVVESAPSKEVPAHVLESTLLPPAAAAPQEPTEANDTEVSLQVPAVAVGEESFAFDFSADLPPGEPVYLFDTSPPEKSLKELREEAQRTLTSNRNMDERIDAVLERTRPMDAGGRGGLSVVRNSLANAILDGRLDSVFSRWSADDQSLSSASSRTASAAGGGGVDFLRALASEAFWQAIQSGELDAVLQEMTPEEDLEKKRRATIHNSARSALLDADGAGYLDFAVQRVVQRHLDVEAGSADALFLETPFSRAPSTVYPEIDGASKAAPAEAAAPPQQVEPVEPATEERREVAARALSKAILGGHFDGVLDTVRADTVRAPEKQLSVGELQQFARVRLLQANLEGKLEDVVERVKDSQAEGIVEPQAADRGRRASHHAEVVRTVASGVLSKAILEGKLDRLLMKVKEADEPGIVLQAPPAIRSRTASEHVSETSMPKAAASSASAPAAAQAPATVEAIRARAQYKLAANVSEVRLEEALARTGHADLYQAIQLRQNARAALWSADRSGHLQEVLSRCSSPSPEKLREKKRQQVGSAIVESILDGKLDDALAELQAPSAAPSPTHSEAVSLVPPRTPLPHLPSVAASLNGLRTPVIKQRPSWKAVAEEKLARGLGSQDAKKLTAQARAERLVAAATKARAETEAQKAEQAKIQAERARRKADLAATKALNAGLEAAEAKRKAEQKAKWAAEAQKRADDISKRIEELMAKVPKDKKAKREVIKEVRALVAQAKQEAEDLKNMREASEKQEAAEKATREAAAVEAARRQEEEEQKAREAAKKAREEAVRKAKEEKARKKAEEERLAREEKERLAAETAARAAEAARAREKVLEESRSSRQLPMVPFNNYYVAYIGSGLPSSSTWSKLYSRFGALKGDEPEEEEEVLPKKRIVVPGPFPAELQPFGNYYKEHVSAPSTSSSAPSPWQNLYQRFPVPSGLEPVPMEVMFDVDIEQVDPEAFTEDLLAEFGALGLQEDTIDDLEVTLSGGDIKVEILGRPDIIQFLKSKDLHEIYIMGHRLCSTQEHLDFEKLLKRPEVVEAAEEHRFEEFCRADAGETVLKAQTKKQKLEAIRREAEEKAAALLAEQEAAERREQERLAREAALRKAAEEEAAKIAAWEAEVAAKKAAEEEAKRKAEEEAEMAKRKAQYEDSLRRQQEEETRRAERLERERIAAENAKKAAEVAARQAAVAAAVQESRQKAAKVAELVAKQKKLQALQAAREEKRDPNNPNPKKLPAVFDLDDGKIQTWQVVLVRTEEESKLGFSHMNYKQYFSRKMGMPEDEPPIGPEHLMVKKVTEGKLLDKWNEEYPDLKVEVGDRIAEINGLRGIEEMQQLLRSDEMLLSMRIVRYPKFFFVDLHKPGKAKLGFKFGKHTDLDRNVPALRITEIAAGGGGMLAAANERFIQEGNFHHVVVPGMWIEAANEVHGDPAFIAEEVRRCRNLRLRIRRPNVSIAVESEKKVAKAGLVAKAAGVFKALRRRS
eukprot:TRINITY_DN22803_c0_g1_i1.p1 TRINITY_DN22803_c0_g1~~TRINITY_DN22803_c0_g1_i1.p1  ORF type:complete len:2383 (-),score=814.98 TRINITY_DN22803_c0_g1_i1:309-6590(-)